MFRRFFDINNKGWPRGNHKGPGDHKARPYRQRLRLVRLVAALFLLPAAVGNSAPATATAGDTLRTLLVDGRPVPVFATPEEQLSYGRSTFEEIEEKSAALKAVEHLHPSAREHAAMAALELAFLSLGHDYRLAGGNQYILARNKYLGILDRYPDLPAVAAKALWYLGWISCDLAADIEEGLGWYQRLITLYPGEKLSFVSQVPWLTIRRADLDRNQPPAYPRAVLTWADIAHLEIIRHTDSHAQAWRSFESIRQAGAGDAFAAAALKILVERHGFGSRGERLVREYLQKAEVDSGLKNDLFLALSAYRRQADGAGESQ